MKRKLNCWEFYDCGRYPGGPDVHAFGICPATTEKKLNGVHDGVNGGRACWVINGTLCKGTRQGTFVEKYDACIECEFYQGVRREESFHFHLTASLLTKLH